MVVAGRPDRGLQACLIPGPARAPEMSDSKPVRGTAHLIAPLGGQPAVTRFLIGAVTSAIALGEPRKGRAVRRAPFTLAGAWRRYFD